MNPSSAPVAPEANPIRPLPRVVLLGNPNSGKTTLFNALTGARARVGNYPGVTVEHREAVLELQRTGSVRLLDLPGTYSLVPRAEDEAVAVDGLLGRLGDDPPPDLVVAVVDATHLERNLYLLVQLREWGLPLVVALTLDDVARADDRPVDALLLSRRIGAPVIPVSAVEGAGLGVLREALDTALGRSTRLDPLVVTTAGSAGLEAAGQSIAAVLAEESGHRPPVPPAALAVWALALVESQAPLTRPLPPGVVTAVHHLGDARARLEPLVAARYRLVSAWMEGVLPEASQSPGSTPSPGSPPEPSPPLVPLSVSERRTARIDAVVLHPVLGPLLLALGMGGLFWLLFSGAQPFMDAIDAAVGWVGEHAAAVIPESLPLLRSLVVEGVVAGVGSVVVFVPQIALLFFCLGLLEDSGYLARAAFLLDRLLARTGLHGRAFVPLLTGFACAVPAIMAARTIESRRDRLVTVLVIPLMSCSARLPVYSLLIAAVFADLPPLGGVVPLGPLLLVAMYALSIALTLIAALLLRRTAFQGPPPPFVLELPPYRLPRLAPLLQHVGGRVRGFLTSAGTVILVATIVLWGLFTFPRDPGIDARLESEQAQVERSVPPGADLDLARAEVDARAAQARLEYSAAGRLGHAIEPALRPLGFDWKVGVGLVASLAAREVLVSTLGLTYGLGDGSDETSVSLRDAMRSDRRTDGTLVHTPLSALSLMVFFVIALQCMSTLAAVRRETGGFRWPLIQFGAYTLLAYAASWITYQGGQLLGFA